MSLDLGKSLAEGPRRIISTCKISVPSNGYLSAIFLILFTASFFIYLEKDFLALIFLSFAFLFVPILLITDKIVFDGNQIRRTGIFPKLWALLNSRKSSLKLNEINKVETLALRVFKNGSRVFYRYRTMVRGEKAEFVFISNNGSYRKFIKALTFALPEEVLDLKTLEIRDFLPNPKEIEIESERLGLPSDDFLEEMAKTVRSSNGYKKNCKKIELAFSENTKSEELRKIGNQLKLLGHFLRALESFRRSLLLNPNNAWLIFDYARCLYSFADSEKNEKLKMRSIAALRLAEIRSKNDKKLLTLLGESYYQYGDLKNARKTFQKILDLGLGDFRVACGLAEVALREGKLKQVVYYLSMASRLTQNENLRRWAENEAKYFAKLDNDYDYAKKEINRINWLNNFFIAKKFSLKVAFLGFMTIIIGTLTSEWLIDLGWIISVLGLLGWLGFNASNSFLMERNP